ncbi:MAG: cytochrome c oxidase subunit 3 [Flavobacteriales bacterium]|nr:cytochrome c oxidase subunit 3 [Flavobacteriales bacterium]
MELAVSKNEKLSIRQKSSKPLLYIGIVSIVMLFAGLTSAYVVRRGAGDWVSFELPSAFFSSTFAIVLSSLFLFIGLKFAKRDRSSLMWVFLTFIGGLAFTYYQFQAYGALVDSGIFFTGGNASASFLYVITGLHLAHVIGGLIVLLVTVIQATRGKYNSTNTLGLELASIYWHFLGLLWIYLLTFLLYIR